MLRDLHDQPAVDLHGGPHDGKAAHTGGRKYTQYLELLHVPDTPMPAIASTDMVQVNMCLYVHRGDGQYDFASIRVADMTKNEHQAFVAAQKVYAELRALVTDPRINQGWDGPVPDNALPLSKAKAMKRRAIPAARRWLKAEGISEEGLTDEKAWAWVTGRLLAELEWADMGAGATLDYLRHVTYDLFGIKLMPQDK